PPVAICFLAIILGVGIDDGVHLLAAATRGQDVWDVVGETGSILLLTSLSTACGFGVLVLAHHPALAVLGKIVALGVMICWLTTIGLLAPLVAWLQTRGNFDGGAAKRERDG
ncbi:MAG: hypothetical protein ACC742_16920, partial [Thermoanaerobaculales bacterium]